MSLNGLSGINLELTSRCNKHPGCPMCGRRKIEKQYPQLANWGDIPLELVEQVAEQLPFGVFIQLHNNGEPLMYPRLGEALEILKGHYMGFNTNGKLIMEKANQITGHLSTITVSIIPDDREGCMQLDTVESFLALSHRPPVIFRLLGKIDEKRVKIIEKLSKKYKKFIICHRILHKPEGSFGYEKPVTIPEIGVCLEMLHKLAIDRFGNVYPCVRFDPERKNLLGNLSTEYLDTIWNGLKRRQWVRYHLAGERNRVPLCKTCDFWGVPRG